VKFSSLSVSRQLKRLAMLFPDNSAEALVLKKINDAGGNIEQLTHGQLLIWVRNIEPVWKAKLEQSRSNDVN
jgi:hypothetical protein